LSSPESVKSSTEAHAQVGAGPASTAAGMALPTRPRRTGGRRQPAQHPVEPAGPDRGAGRGPFSSSIAEKCERLGAGWPTAWTAPNVPAFQNGSSGASAGFSPK
jgi:hypothetical protein